MRASAAAVEGAASAPTSLRELTKDDYESFLREAGDVLVIVDCYTDWHGPLTLTRAGRWPVWGRSRPPQRCYASGLAALQSLA